MPYIPLTREFFSLISGSKNLKYGDLLMNFTINILSFCIIFFASFGHACDTVYDENEGMKYYVDSQNLLIEEGGLFLIEEGEVIPLKSIAVDHIGMYIIAKDKISAYTCPNGHSIYHPKPSGCGGCSNWWCAFRCKCCSPWAKVKAKG